MQEEGCPTGWEGHCVNCGGWWYKACETEVQLVCFPLLCFRRVFFGFGLFLLWGGWGGAFFLSGRAQSNTGELFLGVCISCALTGRKMWGFFPWSWLSLAREVCPDCGINEYILSIPHHCYLHPFTLPGFVIGSILRMFFPWKYLGVSGSFSGWGRSVTLSFAPAHWYDLLGQLQIWAVPPQTPLVEEGSWRRAGSEVVGGFHPHFC